MAHPDGPGSETVRLEYNWVEYFGFAFHMRGSELIEQDGVYRIVDAHPCNGDPLRYLAGHFDVRGVPAFNQLYDEAGHMVFPLMRMRDGDAQVDFCVESASAVS